MEVYLIRHAQTKSNLKGIDFDDRKATNLNKKGIAQAKKLAHKFVKVKIDKIFISESRRSYQTALPLIKLKSVPVVRDARLNEADFGIFSGLTFEMAKRKYPEIYSTRLVDKRNYRIPKGESFKDVSKRLDSFLKNLKKEPSSIRTVLIITHGTVLKVFLVKFLKFSLKKADSVYFKNTSSSSFKFKNRKMKAETINGSLYPIRDTLKNKGISQR